MQLGLRPRLKARPSLVDLLNRAKSPPASPAPGSETGTAAAPGQRPSSSRAVAPPPLARLEEAAVQALAQPLPTSPTSTSTSDDNKELSESASASAPASASTSSTTNNSSTPQLTSHHQHPQQQQQPRPSTPTTSLPLADAQQEARAAAAQRPTSPQKTVNMAPVCLHPSLFKLYCIQASVCNPGICSALFCHCAGSIDKQISPVHQRGQAVFATISLLDLEMLSHHSISSLY